MEKSILEKIKQADMVLVGIGEELDHLSWKESDPESVLKKEEVSEELVPFYKSLFYCENKPDSKAQKIYNEVARLLKGKPYFVVSMCTDGEIYHSDLNSEQIVTPCGDITKMQCSEHIVDALGIDQEVISTKNPAKSICPQCGKPLEFHTIKTEGYLEEGYLKQWEKYTKWLTCTLNRNLVVLELGVGFKYPQVVRWPFEKTVYYNKKAYMIRVNSSLAQLPEELAGKGTSVTMKVDEFLGV